MLNLASFVCCLAHRTRTGSHLPGADGGGNRQATRVPSEQKIEALPIKIHIKFSETGKSTGIHLTPKHVATVTSWQALGEVLTGPGGFGAKLTQLGYKAGAYGIAFIDSDGAIIPASRALSAEELESHGDSASAICFSTASSRANAATLSSNPTPAPAPVSGSSPAQQQVMDRSTAPSGPLPASSNTNPPVSHGKPGKKGGGPDAGGAPAIVKADINDIIARNSRILASSAPVVQTKRALSPETSPSGKSGGGGGGGGAPQPPVSPSKEALDAFAQPKKLAAEKASLNTGVDADRLATLTSQLEGFVEAHRKKDKKTLLKDIKGHVTQAGFAELERQAAIADGAWGGLDCLARIRGYIDFAKHHSLGGGSKLIPLEFRDEEDGYYPGQIFSTPKTLKSYALVPPEWTLLRDVSNARLSYLLDDSGGLGLLSRWATGRLIDSSLASSWDGPDATRPIFGLVGQMEGVSKQVHVSGPSGLDAGDRRECLKACTPDDPDEYPVLVEPEMDIYLVEVQVGRDAEVDSLLRPLAVLDAAVFGTDPAEAGIEESQRFWRTQPGYGDGFLPGFGGGGQAVALINSKRISASSASELQARGITCRLLPPR